MINVMSSHYGYKSKSKLVAALSYSSSTPEYSNIYDHWNEMADLVEKKLKLQQLTKSEDDAVVIAQDVAYRKELKKRIQAL